MPIYKQETTEFIKTCFDKLSNDTLSYHEIIGKLAIEEDDWSFVIKTHAFIEMFISESLVKFTGDEQFEKLMQRLPLADSRIGKLSLCKDLGLLDKPQRKFLKFYSELRNKLIHRFENVSFSFSEYLSSLNKPEIKKWQSSLIWFPLEGKAKKTWDNIAIENPRTAIWFGIFIIASVLNIDCSHKKFKKDLEHLALENSEKLFSELTKK
jgi:hypothetical protein